MRILCAVLEKLLRRRTRILRNQSTIIERIEAMSQVLDQIREYAARIDEATNAIAARIQSLVGKVNARTATAEEIAAMLLEVDRLGVLGKDPSALA